MAYVLDYTIIAAGLPYQSTGTDHSEALRRFISQPSITLGYRRGNYVCGDGEKIIVVGPSQESWSAREAYRARLRLAREAVASAKTGIRKAQERLREIESRPEPVVETEMLTFYMRKREVFDPILEDEYVNADEHREKMQSNVRVASVGFQCPIRLIVNRERMFPSAKALQGVPESSDDEGVWMNGYLIPWEDITDLEILEIEVPA